MKGECETPMGRPRGRGKKTSIYLARRNLGIAKGGVLGGPFYDRGETGTMDKDPYFETYPPSKAFIYKFRRGREGEDLAKNLSETPHSGGGFWGSSSR